MAAILPRARIAHLLRRAGFGASEAELSEYVALGFEASVERLIHPEQVADDLDAKIAALKLDLDTVAALPVYWLFRMINTQRPLQEKMTLVWHDHFATTISKVRSPQLMLMQHQLFLQRGLGSFYDLTLGVSQDPAMLVWLDGNQNRKNAPNENYGRELLELFMLGLGNYTEADVAAAARAFTGWFFQAERDNANNNRITSAKFAFNERQHDFGQKTFLGQTGTWKSDDFIRIMLGWPACAASSRANSSPRSSETTPTLRPSRPSPAPLCGASTTSARPYASSPSPPNSPPTALTARRPRTPPNWSRASCGPSASPLPRATSSPTCA